MSMKPSSKLEQSCADGARLALAEARKSFLPSSLNFDIFPTSTLPTGVEFDPANGRSRLYLNLACPMASVLRDSVNDWKEAWLLVLAHESGHLQLNVACMANNEAPGEPDAQLRAIGMPTAFGDATKIADFQKETAIEAFCDGCLAKLAVDLLGSRWRIAVETLIEHRAAESQKIGLFKGNEYATEPGLKAFLLQNGGISPKEAAEISLLESIRHTSTLKKTAVAAAMNLSDLKTSFHEGLDKWRVKRDVQKTTEPPNNGPPSL